jgi:type II secretory pathway pseudopilin PulG
MNKIRTAKGFALVEIVVVTLLLGGAFIVFIHALNETKLMQVKSEIRTIQTVLLNSKINQIRNTSFSTIFPVNNFTEFENNPGYHYKINVKHTDQTFTSVYDNTTTDFKLITIEIRHGPNEDVVKILADTFVVSNII